MLLSGLYFLEGEWYILRCGSEIVFFLEQAV